MMALVVFRYIFLKIFIQHNGRNKLRQHILPTATGAATTAAAAAKTTKASSTTTESAAAKTTATTKTSRKNNRTTKATITATGHKATSPSTFPSAKHSQYHPKNDHSYDDFS
jgi:hypothetical protein